MDLETISKKTGKRLEELETRFKQELNYFLMQGFAQEEAEKRAMSKLSRDLKFRGTDRTVTLEGFSISCLSFGIL